MFLSFVLLEVHWRGSGFGDLGFSSQDADLIKVGVSIISRSLSDVGELVEWLLYILGIFPWITVFGILFKCLESFF